MDDEDSPTHEGGFEALVRDVEPKLRQALVGLCGDTDAHDAVAEALLYAWRNRDRVLAMDNPAGYLYRVARSHVGRSRRRKPRFQPLRDTELPEIEPGLIPALRRLSERQRVTVFLVEGCGWTHPEVGQLLGISASAVGTHVARGLERLRRSLGDETR
jgi:RNA polymerase sigma-70 factor (ECF subfamily)